MLEYSIPITISNYFTTNIKTNMYSFSLSFTPYSTSKLWAPRYSLSLSQYDETTIDSKTKSITLSLSNTIMLNNRTYLAPYLSINKVLNIDPAFAYLDLSPSLTFGYSFKSFSLLSFNLTSSYLKRIYSNDQTNNFTIGSSFNLNF